MSILWPSDANNWLWKRPWYWERLKAVGEGDEREWNGWMASLAQWTWVWASCRSWWWTGKPGVLQSMGLQRVGQEWATEVKEQTFGGLVNVCEFQTLHLGNVMNYNFILASLRELNKVEKNEIFQCLVHYECSVQFSSVTQSCPILWGLMDGSTPGLPVHHQLPESTQTHVHWVADAIQLSHPLLSSSPWLDRPLSAK